MTTSGPPRCGHDRRVSHSYAVFRPTQATQRDACQQIGNEASTRKMPYSRSEQCAALGLLNCGGELEPASCGADTDPDWEGGNRGRLAPAPRQPIYTRPSAAPTRWLRSSPGRRSSSWRRRGLLMTSAPVIPSAPLAARSPRTAGADRRHHNLASGTVSTTGKALHSALRVATNWRHGKRPPPDLHNAPVESRSTSSTPSRAMRERATTRSKPARSARSRAAASTCE